MRDVKLWHCHVKAHCIVIKKKMRQGYVYGHGPMGDKLRIVLLSEEVELQGDFTAATFLPFL